MKKLILPVLLLAGIVCSAQEKPKLKDLLYSGKLKKDSTGVIRSTDDLSTKIDTSRKAAPSEPEKVVKAPVSQKIIADSASVATTTPSTPEVVTESKTKSNTRIWQDHLKLLTEHLKAEVLKAKQIKKETYFMLFDYTIETDGKVTVNAVTSTPSNETLQAQVRLWLDNTPLQLNPVAKKATRRQQFTVTKD